RCWSPTRVTRSGTRSGGCSSGLGSGRRRSASRARSGGTRSRGICTWRGSRGRRVSNRGGLGAHPPAASVGRSLVEQPLVQLEAEAGALGEAVVAALDRLAADQL